MNVVVLLAGGSHDGFRVMESRFPGKCQASGLPFRKGEKIAYKKDAALAGRLGFNNPSIVVKWPQAANATPATVKSRPTFTPSGEQRSILDYIHRETAHLVIKARAGTGKTTTMAWAMFLLFDMVKSLIGHVLMLVFGKRNAEEMAEKLPNGVQSGTIHSHGYHALKAAYPRAELAAGVKPRKFKRYLKPKTHILLDQIIAVDLPNDHPHRIAARAVPKLVAMAKQYALLPGQTVEIDALIDHEVCPIELGKADRVTVVELACKVLAAGMPRNGHLDYHDMDDMIYLAAILPEVVFPVHRLVIIDEMQDVNRSMILIIRKMVDAKSRLVVIGDDAQSVMGFRGSDLNAFSEVEAMLAASELGVNTLPLSINRRCGKVHIRNVQWHVADIQADPTAPEGTLETCGLARFFGNVKVGSAVLVRTNQIGMAFARHLRRLRVPVVMKGKEEDGDRLIRMVDAITAGKTLSQVSFMEAVQSYHASKLSELQAAPKPSAFRINLLNEDCDTLAMIAASGDTDGLHPVRDSEDVKEWIATLFDDDAPPEKVVTVSTIHRAKGLEWSVVWYSGMKTPHPNATTPAALTQEYNLIYVRDTRVRATKEPGTGRLIEIEGDPTGDDVAKIQPDYAPPTRTDVRTDE